MNSGCIVTKLIINKQFYKKIEYNMESHGAVVENSARTTYSCS